MNKREKIVSELGLNKIVQESIKRHPRFADKRVGFIDGAEWMQNITIEKATQWLKEKNKMCMYELEMILGNKFIDDFKKAMKE